MAIPCINSQGVQHVREHLTRVPRPDREAKRAIASWLNTQGIELDPDAIDVVTLHLQPHGPGRYQAQIVKRLSLIQAVLTHWQGESDQDIFGTLIGSPWAGQLPPDGTLEVVESLSPLPWFDNAAPYQVFNGLFRHHEPARFDATTLVEVSAESLQSHIETLDFHARYKTQLDDYWRLHLAQHRLCCKLNFIAACNKQVAEGSLSEAARKLIWQAAGLLPRSATLRISALNIYGYAATDLICMQDAHSDLTVLYVPGNSSPLLEFASHDLLQDWVGERCKDVHQRRALKQHFRLADRPQGLDFSGLDTALDGLAAYPGRHRLPPEHGFFNDDGTWPPRAYVNYRPETYSPPIQGDLFQALAERQRQRSVDDADFVIVSDAQIREQRWRHYLDATLNLLLPMTFVIPELAGLLAVGGIVQLGLGLDQAIDGKTLQDKLDGTDEIVYGLFNAVPGIAQATGKAAGKLFQSWREGFVVPTRLNDQIGYPLSPIDPPRLPELDIAPYFSHSKRIDALPDCDPEVARAVRRYPRYDGDNDLLRGYYEPAKDYVEELSLVYDMDTNLFLVEEQLNDVEPVMYEPDPGTGNMRKVAQTDRPVSDAMRVATLRALGVDLSLPCELPALRPEGSLPIAKKITCLWVGEKLIADDILDNLAYNARLLENSEYRYRLMLSNRNTAVFEENSMRLQSRVPGLEVLPLEEQDFYRAFTQSPGHTQYQAAVTGGTSMASNFASAADVLRYPMLHSEGGLYMDIDDTLLARPEAASKAALDSVELVVTAEGLLLHPPVQSELMHLNSMYNNSMIGSQAGNPTLLKIMEEMHARYTQTADPYPLRPERALDPMAFGRYARQLSWLTGPRLLTDVVDRHLPDLGQIRQLTQLYMVPRINSYRFIDVERLNALREARLPLARVAKIGSLHSWARP